MKQDASTGAPFTGVATYNTSEFEEELAAAPSNRNVGTKLVFEDPSYRVWEIELAPGERAPFHMHAVSYFWACIDGGRTVARHADGTENTMPVEEGVMVYHRIRETGVPLIHDLENVGTVTVRFLTVELMDRLADGTRTAESADAH